MSVATRWAAKLPFGLGLLLALGACGDPETFQTVRGTQLISVIADPPAARPGASVHLELSYFDRDSFETSSEGPGVEVLWIAGCHDPARDSPLSCLPKVARLAAGALGLRDGNETDVSAEEVAANTAFGTELMLQVPSDSVAGRVRGLGSIAYGISYVFYAVCRGHLQLLPAKARQVPLECRDENGQRVPNRDFTLGYTSVYVFDSISSANPKVDGVELDGELVTQSACETDADCAAASSALGYRCFEGACVPEVRRCLDTCDSHRVRPRVPSDAAELDPTSVRVGEAPGRELLWVEYLGIGRFDRLESLISDRAGDRREQYSAEWTAPQNAFPRPVPIWTVVKDNRGGTTQSRIDVLLR